MEFNQEISSAFKELDEVYKDEFVEKYLSHYELLKTYKPTYIFLDTRDEPNTPILAIDWIPSRIGFMLYSTNYRIVPIMEDIVYTINNQHYLSAIVLSRALFEYAANINYYVKRLMSPTQKIMEINEKGKNTGIKNKDFLTEEFTKQIFDVKNIVIDFLASSKPNFDSTKRTEMEKWQKEQKLISPSPKKIIKELPNKFFFNKEPYEDLYHMLCNYTHPNSESNRLTIVDFNESNNGTQFTISRDIKNPVVLINFLNVIYVPVSGSLMTISVALNQLKEILKVFELIYNL